MARAYQASLDTVFGSTRVSPFRACLIVFFRQSSRFSQFSVSVFLENFGKAIAALPVLQGLHSPAKTAFKERVFLWAAKVRVHPKQIRVQRMTRKWASCSTDGRVTFSEELLRQPLGFRDYVVVHELLHLKIPNHGKLFKSLLSAHIPGWKRATLSCCERH